MSFDTFEKLPGAKKDRITAAGIEAFSRRSYQDVSTDSITQSCGISKGILFHYFGSKKGFYLYCLDRAMACLTAQTRLAEGNGFYEILFAQMDRKMELCMACKNEMHMVNMASRDAAEEIAREKGELLLRYSAQIRMESQQTLERALSTLQLKAGMDKQLAAKGLHIYINGVLNRYLLQYQQNPEAFFENSGRIREEIKAYLELMLRGICGKEEI